MPKRQQKTFLKLQEKLKEFELAFNLGNSLLGGEKNLLINRFKKIVVVENKQNYSGRVDIIYPELAESTDGKRYVKDLSHLSKIAFELWSNKINFQEELLVLSIDKQSRLIGHSFLHLGTGDFTPISIKLIFQFLLLTNAYHFAIIHNHPGGDTKASDSDVLITKRVSAAATLLDFNFLGHIILAPTGEHSVLWGEK